MLALAAACNVFAMINFYCFSRAGQGQGPSSAISINAVPFRIMLPYALLRVLS